MYTDTEMRTDNTMTIDYIQNGSERVKWRWLIINVNKLCCCFIHTSRHNDANSTNHRHVLWDALDFSAASSYDFYAETLIHDALFFVLCKVCIANYKTWFLMTILRYVHWTMQAECGWMSATACIQTEQWINAVIIIKRCNELE